MKKRLVAIAIPTYGCRITTAIGRMIEQAAMLSLLPKHPFRYWTLWVEGMRQHDFARNVACDALLASEAEYLYFVDDDMIPPGCTKGTEDALAAFLQGDRNRGALAWPNLLMREEDAVSGLAFGWDSTGDGREPTIRTVIYDRDEAGGYISRIPEQIPFTCDAVGAACLVLSRKAVQVAHQPDKDSPAFAFSYNPRTREIAEGEDMALFRKLNAAGIRVTVDPRVRFGHMKETDLLDVAIYGMAARVRGQQAKEGERRILTPAEAAQ